MSSESRGKSPGVWATMLAKCLNVPPDSIGRGVRCALGFSAALVSLSFLWLVLFLPVSQDHSGSPPEASPASEMINAVGVLAAGLGGLLTGVASVWKVKRQSTSGNPPGSDPDAGESN